MFRESGPPYAGDGAIFGCEMEPYTWKYSDVYPVILNDKRNVEDPRLWLYKSNAYINFNIYPTLHFSPYSVYKKEVSRIMTIPFQGNGEGTLQKNWGFFEYDSAISFIYLPCPLIVLELDITSDSMNLKNLTQDHWNGDSNYRGGSSPVLNPDDGLYYIFVHKTCNYNIWAICFQKDQSDKKWKVKGHTVNQLNKAAGDLIHFVSSAVYDTIKKQWILSGGIRDANIGMWCISHSELREKITWI